MADKWTIDELRVSVRAYVNMQNMGKAGERFSKMDVLRATHKLIPARSVKSIEYRFQNISAVVDELGGQWVTGYKPARNIGRNVKAVIRDEYRATINRRVLLDEYRATINRKVAA